MRRKRKTLLVVDNDVLGPPAVMIDPEFSGMWFRPPEHPTAVTPTTSQDADNYDSVVRFQARIVGLDHGTAHLVPRDQIVRSREPPRCEFSIGPADPSKADANERLTRAPPGSPDLDKLESTFGR
jgi:hypothetical protein